MADKQCSTKHYAILKTQQHEPELQNTMVKRKKGQKKMLYKALHIQLMIEQHEHH